MLRFLISAGSPADIPYYYGQPCDTAEAGRDIHQSQPFSWERRDGLRTQQIMLA